MWVRRRATYEIYAAILAAIDIEVKAVGQAQVRRVQRRSNTEYTRLKFYIDEMVQLGLITAMWPTLLSLTPKGTTFLKAYGEALELLGRKIEVL